MYVCMYAYMYVYMYVCMCKAGNKTQKVISNSCTIFN